MLIIAYHILTDLPKIESWTCSDHAFEERRLKSCDLCAVRHTGPLIHDAVDELHSIGETRHKEIALRWIGAHIQSTAGPSVLLLRNLAQSGLLSSRLHSQCAAVACHTDRRYKR